MENRKSHYASFSNQVDTTSLSLEGSAWQVQTQFDTFRVTGMGDGYDVRVRSHGMDTLPEMLDQSQKKSPLGIVVDSNVAPLYGPGLKNQLEKAGYKANLMIIPAGENSKSVSSLEFLWGEFLSAGLERSSVVLALGGGVIGDLAGFAAATYMRGISWVGIPTSLLAMVDSSIGGKTGINLEQGKNLAGVFHSPDFVIADPKLLSTLPEMELRNGLAEVVKHGVLADPGLFEMLASGWVNVQTHLEEVVKRAVAVKIKFISADPYEKGVRAALNFGHTLGHALEKGSDYQLRHGEAVSIGMVYETKLAEKMGIAQAGLSVEIAEALFKLGLPTQMPTGLDPDKLFKGIRFDKKKKDGVVRFALPAKIGAVQPSVIVKEEDIKWMITN
jgi:3-dehydroquinate synthase